MYVTKYITENVRDVKHKIYDVIYVTLNIYYVKYITQNMLWNIYKQNICDIKYIVMQII